MTGLLDSNLQRAYDDLADVRRALAFLHIADSGRGDPIATILAWIDWDESKPWDSANHVGRGPSSGMGEMQTAIDELTKQRNALATAWKGAAAEVFLDFSASVLENCRRVVEELQAMVKVMASGEGTTHQAMKDLTKNAWKAAGDIADDSKVKEAVERIFHSNDQQERSDARLELLGVIERLKRGVTAEVDRIDENVLVLVKPFAYELSLKNPLTGAGGPPSKTEIDLNIARPAGQAMLPAIAGIKRAARSMEEAWHAVDQYSFGTSANAQQVLHTWRQALAHRRTDIANCYGQAKGMYGGMSAVMHRYAYIENNNQERIDNILSGDMQRQRLDDYWHKNASGKGPDGTAPIYNETAETEAELDALDEGWNGKGDVPSDSGPGEVKNPEPPTPAEIADEIGQRGVRGGLR
ncbi:hypothetical protein ABN028_31565 [Actinopolymorpha sp. B17G11]|uniref:hypothetical protein n=1 Tax=Actinopolymorpha sp. B17G11 TaxID=3160861 RepID=UPI0032E402C2